MGQNDAGQQLRQIKDCLKEPEGVRPAAIVVFPVSESGLSLLAEAAAQSGIGWVTLNRTSHFMESLRAAHPGLPLFCVNPDQVEIGRIQGRQARALLPNGGQAVCIQGPAAVPSARLRLAGLQEELKGGSISLSAYVGDWSFAGGAREATRWIEALPGGKLRDCVVIGQNDEMAMGARTMVRGAAVRRPELANLRFIGCDGTRTFGQRLVAEKQLDATVIIPSTSSLAMEQIAAVLDGGPAPAHDFAPAVTSLLDLAQLRATVGGTAA
jgi:ABC-type sugar transport system substrate-binding protein